MNGLKYKKNNTSLYIKAQGYIFKGYLVQVTHVHSVFLHIPGFFSSGKDRQF